MPTRFLSECLRSSAGIRRCNEITIFQVDRQASGFGRSIRRRNLDLQTVGDLGHLRSLDTGMLEGNHRSGASKTNGYFRLQGSFRLAIEAIWEPWVAWAYGASFDRQTELHIVKAGLELGEITIFGSRSDEAVDCTGSRRKPMR